MARAVLQTTKDGRQYYRIFVSRDHNYSYSCRWYVPQGWSERSIKAGLKKAEADFEERVKNGSVKSRSEQKEQERIAEEEAKKIQTLKQYGEKVFMPQLSITASENTRFSFQGILDNHIYPALGDIKLPAITPEQISAFLLSLQSEKRLAHASCIKIYTVLNLIFKQAYLSRMISPNPMDFVQRPKARKNEIKDEQIPSYNGQEMAYILRCIDSEPLKWRALIWLIADTGCRRGEALGMKWNRIDFDNGTVTIDSTLNYSPSVGIYLDTPRK